MEKESVDSELRKKYVRTMYDESILVFLFRMVVHCAMHIGSYTNEICLQ